MIKDDFPKRENKTDLNNVSSCRQGNEKHPKVKRNPIIYTYKTSVSEHNSMFTISLSILSVFCLVLIA